MHTFNRINFWGKGFYYLLFACLFFSIFTNTAHAATGINQTINFQGKLVNSDGTNVSNGSYSIVFSLYTVSSGGSAAWTETDSVTTTDGVFRVGLGGTTTFASAGVDFTTDTYYLGIKVGTDAEMTPRVQFTAVPYAFNAQKVNGLTIASGKTVTLNNSLTFNGTDSTAFTFPSTTGGTVLTTNQASQTINSGQTSGTILSIAAGTPTLGGALTGLQITTNGTGAQDQTGLKIVVSGASGTNQNGLVINNGTSNTLTVTKAGVITDTNYAGANAIIYAAPTTGLFTSATTTTGSQCLTSQAGTSGIPTWGSCGGTNYWSLSGSTISPTSGAVNLAIGQTTALTNSGLDIEVNSKGNSTLVVNNSGGLGDIFTASSAGVAKFTVDKNGNVVLGADNTTPGAVTVRGAAASGTDVAGGNVTFDASNGTGAGGSGDLIFRTAAAAGGTNTVTIDHTTDYDTAGSSVASKAVSFTVNSQSNNLIILSASINSSTHTISTVSDSVNGAFTKAAGTPNGSVYTSIWYLKGPSVGAHTITITPSSSDTIIGSVTQMYNVDQTTPVGTAVSNTGSGTTTSVAVTSTNTTQLVYDTVANPGSGTFSAPLGTQIYNHNAASSSQVAGSTITGSSGTTNLGWTISATNSWVDIGIPINPSSGGGGSTTADTLTDRFHITASGNVGIGTSTPGALFDIEGSGSFMVDSTGAITTSSVGQGALKTATGSTTSSNTSVNITMNDYNFFPSITCSSGNVALQTYNAADPGNTTGRFRAVACGTGNTLTVRWRYITASDHPTIWAIVNADGSVSSSVWEAEDPMEPTKYPENPNPLTDTPLQSGQYYLSPQPASIAELKTLYSKFPQSDSDAVLNDLKQYVVDTRHWVSSFDSLDDISKISDRYQPAAREWAVRLLADHYKVSPALAIHLFFSVSNNNLVTVSDPYANLQAYNAQLAQKQSVPNSQQQADLAEWYQQEQNGNAQAGDVVSVNEAGTLSKATTPYDEHIAGIVSTSPFQVMGNQQNANDLQLALTGKVPVHVSTRNGEIHIGDYLTSSSNPGVAMKATKAGKVIGQALESYTGVGAGTILVKVENTHFGGVFLSKSGLTTGENTDIHTLLEAETGIASATESASQIFTDKVVAGLSVIAPKVVTGNLQVDKIQSATGKDISLEISDDGKFILANASGSAAVQFDAKGNAFFNGSITADKIQANQIEGLDVVTNQLAQLSDQIASLSAKLSVLGASTAATNVTTTSATRFNSDDSLEGLLINTDATISGKLRVKGSGLFEGILSVIDTLKANDFMTTGIAEFFNTAVFHNDISFEGRPTFNADTAGFALIKKESDHIDITFDKPYQTTPVVNATLSVTSTSVTPTPINGKTLEQRLLDEGYYYIVTKQSTKGFTILLNKQASEDVQFSWSALSIKDAKLFQSGGATPTPIVSLTPVPSDFLLSPEASSSAE